MLELEIPHARHAFSRSYRRDAMRRQLRLLEPSRSTAAISSASSFQWHCIGSDGEGEDDFREESPPLLVNPEKNF